VRARLWEPPSIELRAIRGFEPAILRSRTSLHVPFALGVRHRVIDKLIDHCLEHGANEYYQDQHDAPTDGKRHTMALQAIWSTPSFGGTGVLFPALARRE
jgi:hypothetical protein